VEFLGADKDLADVTAGDADDFGIWLKGRYAGATTGRTIRRAQQFFRAAVRQELIVKNPFADARPPSQANEARKFFVTQEAAYKVLDACPNAEWRLLFALCRFGGLRCPSETLAVRWADVDWERSRFRVDSPKTGVRWVPIFPELRPYLDEAFELAADGAVYLINHYRDCNQNMRSQLQRIIRRAGLEPWPKLFHNLRATRETELRRLTRFTSSVHGSATPPRSRRSTTSKCAMRTSPARPPARAAQNAAHSTPKRRRIRRSTERAPSTH
jgi:integrase